MAEFNQLVGLVDSILEKKYDKEQKEITRVYESIEREKSRSFEKEMRELGQQYDLQKVAMTEQIKIKNQNLQDLETLEETFLQSVGSLPKKSSTYLDSMKVIKNAYQQPINNINEMIELNTKETNVIQQEQNKIQESLSGIVKEAKQYLSTNYGQYTNVIDDDNILSPFELDLLVRDFKTQETNATIDNLVNVISVKETGARAERNNNPGAMIYSPWMNKFGATKDESEAFWVSYDDKGNKTEYFNQADADEAQTNGLKVNKHYTATFSTIKEGEDALRMLVNDKWAGSSGVSDFLESYTGLKSTTAEFANYSKIFDSLELLSSDESEIAEQVMKKTYFENTDPSKKFYTAYSMRQAKAEEFKTAAENAYINLQEIYTPRTTGDLNGKEALGNIVEEYNLEDSELNTLHEILTQPNAAAVSDYLLSASEADPNGNSRLDIRLKNLQSLNSKMRNDRLFEDLTKIGEQVKQIDIITNPENQSQNVNSLREIVRNSKNIKDATQDYYINYFSEEKFSKGEREFFDSEFRELMQDKYGSSAIFELGKEMDALIPETKFDKNKDDQVNVLDIIQGGAKDNFLTEEGLLNADVEQSLDYILSDKTDVNKNSFTGMRSLMPEFTDDTAPNYARDSNRNRALNTEDEISSNIVDNTALDYEEIFDKIQAGDSQRIVSPYAIQAFALNKKNK